MWARDLKPHARCAFIGQDDDTGAIAQCGRWKGHPGDHQSRPEVQQMMAEAIAAVMGYEHPTNREHSIRDYLVMRATLYWYERLVLSP